MSKNLTPNKDMKLDLATTWITSDTHYNHTNICKGITRWDLETEKQLEAVRDFATLEEMNKSIIDGINSNVSENDTLIHGGDWSFGGFEYIEIFREMINCKNIIFTIGNHDHHIERNKGNIQRIFKKVSHYLELEVNEKKIVVCHYPILSWNGLRKGSYMLHGHQHLKGDKRFSTGRRMDIGLCGSPEFRPYRLEEVMNLLEDKSTEE